MALNPDPLPDGRPLAATTVELGASSPAADPLAWLAVATEVAWFWEVPEDGTAWAGLGTAATVETAGPRRIGDGADAARRMLEDLEVDAADGLEAPVAEGTEARNAQSHLTGRAGRRPLVGEGRGPHHEAGEGGGVGLGDRQGGGDGLAAAQHGGLVAEAGDLVELVADEDDRPAVVGHVAQHLAQFLGLGGRQHGRGLVQDQDAGVAPQGLEDLDPLPLPHRELPHRAVGLGGQPEAAAQLAHPLLEVAPAQHPLGGAQHHVLGHRERRDQAELLVDHADPGGQGVGR